jgi:SNF2 family DNA or RNA helicase
MNPRIEALLAVLRAVHGKAIIWASFRESQREIFEHITTEFGSNSVVMYVGSTPDAVRTRNIEAFQNGDARFLIASQQAAARGLTLTAATDVIYYNNTYSLELRLQSEDRAHRIGQTKTVTYTDLEAIGTLERGIIDALRNKYDIASQVTGDKLREWLKY